VRLIAIIAIIVLASAEAQTQFEVASIKPALPGEVNQFWSGGPGTRDPGLFNCQNVDLADLVVMAYDIPWYRFSGLDWMRSTRFNISAKIPEGTTKEQFKLMQQNLLTERFKMTLHHQQKEMQGYDLVAAKGGPNMNRIKPSPDPPPADDPNAYAALPGPPQVDKDGFPIPPPQRGWRTVHAGRRITQPCTDATMERVAGFLASAVGRPVNDATALKGKYDFVLKWVLEGPVTEDSSPTIFEALQQQLGLKLESKKEMVDVLVVDHIEKAPTEN